MEIRVLKYFLAVAQEGSITAAANYLHLTQPTLTRQLQDLEHELKQKLFIRGKQKITLTSEGLLLKKRAEQVIELVEKTEKELKSISDVLSGDIYIGCGETEQMKYIAVVLKEIQEKYKGVKFHIQSGDSEDVIEKLDKGLLDFGLLIQPIDLKKYDNITLPACDVWGVLMKKDCPLAKKDGIELEDLKELPLINSRQASKKITLRSDFADWFKGEFENLNTVGTSNLIYNAAIMVKAGLGYAITLDRLINTSDSELCFRPLKPRLKSGLDIVYKKNQVFSPCAKLFLDKLKEKYGNKN